MKFKCFSINYRLSDILLNKIHKVSHFCYSPLFQGPHCFLQKCWNRTFSMIIYLLTFYLFDDIEKKIEITHVNHSATSKAILKKMHVQPERLYFLFVFCARHYPW